MSKYYNLSLKNLEYRLRRFKPVLEETLKEIIQQYSDVIIEMVTYEQLWMHGVNGKGTEIMSYQPYRPSTIKRKIKKGQPYNRVTLRDTGEFYDSLRVEFDSKGFYVTSTDDKAQYLLKKYGTTIFRLSDENLRELLNEYVRPELKERMTEYLKNG